MDFKVVTRSGSGASCGESGAAYLSNCARASCGISGAADLSIQYARSGGFLSVGNRSKGEELGGGGKLGCVGIWIMGC